MGAQEELRRLRTGPVPGERPDFGVWWFIAKCPGNAPHVLQRCREVLEVVLMQLDAERWPTELEWRSLLPPWFVEECAEERTAEEMERELARWRALPWTEQARLERTAEWSLLNWLYWFDPHGGEPRYWLWWDALVRDGNTVWVGVDQRELPWGTLDWLLRAAGADSVDQATLPEFQAILRVLEKETTYGGIYTRPPAREGQPQGGGP